MTLTLHNSLTRQKEAFTPLDEKNIRMYVCGPTVYNKPHIGNARAVVVYDVLYRLLRHLYGENSVTYARNITDVDDKIIVAAKERNIPISQLTQEVTDGFHADMAALNCLRPDHEPRATEYMPQMIAMIEKLIQNGNAYEAEGHVLFSVASESANKNWSYGMLSGRKLDDLIAGARVEVESYKRNAGDFVLWKPANEGDDASAVFDSPWGKGRPGWHIECSAMSTDILGETFDIHGGGADLKFPHHENEIAQSCCANPGSEFAKHWLHNGFLTVNGEKMSKSLGNFVTVEDLLQKGIHGEVIRFALLSAKYNEPLDWNEKLLSDSKKTLDGWYRILSQLPDKTSEDDDFSFTNQLDPLYSVLHGHNNKGALLDDLNIPLVRYELNTALKLATAETDDQRYQKKIGQRIRKAASLLGILQHDPEEWFKGAAGDNADAEIDALIIARAEAKKAKNWSESDRIRDELKAQGIVLEDRPDGTTDWRRE